MSILLDMAAGACTAVRKLWRWLEWSAWDADTAIAEAGTATGYFRADAHRKQVDVLNAEVLLNKLAWKLSYHSLAELVKDRLAGLVKSRLGGLAKDRHTKAIHCMLTSY